MKRAVSLSLMIAMAAIVAIASPAAAQAPILEVTIGSPALVPQRGLLDVPVTVRCERIPNIVLLDEASLLVVVTQKTGKHTAEGRREVSLICNEAYSVRLESQGRAFHGGRATVSFSARLVGTTADGFFGIGDNGEVQIRIKRASHGHPLPANAS
jgi:hypothetical protein